MSKSLKGYQCNELKSCRESLPKSLGFVQQATTTNCGNLQVSGKSAVQRLEESKANYVKTESVLDCRQQLWNSSYLKVTTRPTIGAYLKNSTKDLRKEPPTVITREPCSVYWKENLEEFPREPRVGFAPNHNQSRDPVLPPAQTKPQSSAGNPACLPTHHHGAKQLEQGFKKRKFKKENSVVKSAIQCFESGFQGARPDDDGGGKEEDWNAAVTLDWQEPSGENFLFPKHSESEGHSSGADSKRSSSVGDITELENQCPRSKTSDYVSRSSSFKCAYSSDRVKSLISSFEAKMNENIEYKKTKDVPVGRSKSDIGHRFFKGTEKNIVNTNNNEELEGFFDSMGLDAKVWDHLASRPESPAQFFDSVSSLNSGDHRSSTDSDESDGLKEGLTNADLRRHGPTETSIIEKNARVVKWLYSCRNCAK